jgi:hypothetical protein
VNQTQPLIISKDFKARAVSPLTRAIQSGITSKASKYAVSPELTNLHPVNDASSASHSSHIFPQDISHKTSSQGGVMGLNYVSPYAKTKPGRTRIVFSKVPSSAPVSVIPVEENEKAVFIPNTGFAVDHIIFT